MQKNSKTNDINGRRTILIVDDNAVERTVLAGFLKQDYEVLSAAGGAAALDMLERWHESVAAIVLDIVMPEMDGYAVMARLRETERFSHIPIVVSTGMEDDETREKSIAYGVNGFVTKPFKRALLLHALENAVRLRDVAVAAEQTKAARQQRKLLDNLPSGAALYEYDGERLSAVHINRRYWKLVGREGGDCAELSVMDAIHPEDRVPVEQELRSAIRQGRNMEVDLRILDGDGGYKPFHVSATVTEEAGGKYALFASFTPISGDALSIQRMLPIALSTMMSSSNDYSYVMDRDFHYICCSRSTAQLLGLENERDIFGKTDADLFGEALSRRFSANNLHIAQTGEPLVNHLEEIPGRDGGVVFVSTSIYPIKDADGRVIGQYGISHDVTRERQLNFELDTLLNTIPSGVLKYAADEGEQFAYINRNFVESLGYTQASFKEKFHNCFREMIWHEDREQAEAEVIRQESGGAIGKFDYRVEAADGQLRWIHDEGIKVTDQHGKSWYYVALFDITEQRQAQEKLRVNEEVNRLAMEHSGKVVAQFDARARTLKLPESMPAIFELPQVLENVPEAQIAQGLISDETADAYRAMFSDIALGGACGTAAYQQRSMRGWRWLEARYTTVFSNEGDPFSAVITFEDITERLEKELVYSKWQQSLTDRPVNSYTLFRCNLSKNAFFDSCEGTLLDVGFAESKQDFGELTTSYVHQHVFEEDRDSYLAFVNSDSMLAGYYRGRRADSLEYREVDARGNIRWLRLSVELVEYPNSRDVEVYLMYEDINEAKLEALKTKAKAENDPLTGVLNRSAFVSRMEQMIDESRTDERHALLMLDVDDFKRVNDTYGHEAGDRLLIALTREMRARLRRDDLVGRLGGDEFLIFLKGIPGDRVAAAKAQQICQMKLAVGDAEMEITFSVGIAMIPRDGIDFETIYKKVDAALYRRKAAGKKGLEFVGK